MFDAAFPFPVTGGKEKQAYLLSQELIKNGIDVMALSYIHNGNETELIDMLNIKRIKKDKELDTFKNNIFRARKTLPFTPRWYYREYGKNKVDMIIEKLRKLGYLREYPILVEESGGYVSQYEHTVIVLEKEALVTTS